MRARLCLSIAAVIACAHPVWAQSEGEEDAPVILPTRLAGLNEAGVRRQLGEPALARAEGAGGVWTYRPPACVLFVYFADEGRGLRVSGVSSGPRRHGDAGLEPEACLAQAVSQAATSPPKTPAEPARP